VNLLGPFPKGSIEFNTGLLLAFVGLGFQFFFWFKALYHWSQAKGYSGALAAVGVLGFPIATLILAILTDNAATPPSPDDPWLPCPNCDAKYRLGDYRKDAEQIFCATCKCELPRPEKGQDPS